MNIKRAITAAFLGLALMFAAFSANAQSPFVSPGTQTFVIVAGEPIDTGSKLAFRTTEGVPLSTVMYGSEAGSELPEELMWNVDSGAITGAIPDTASDDMEAQTSYNYKGIGSGGQISIPNDFTIEVIDVEPEAPTAPVLTFTQGQSVPVDIDPLPAFGDNIRADLKPIADNDNIYPSDYTVPTFEYTLMALDSDGMPIALPAWLNFNPTTRVLSSTPSTTVAGESFKVRYTASEGTDRDTAFVDFTITVEVLTPPTSPGSQTIVIVAGEPINTGLKLAFPNLDSRFSYTTPTPALQPDDLMWARASATITGTIPDTTGDDSSMAMTTSYNYNAGAGTITTPNTFTIEVIDVEPVAPTPPALSFTHGKTIAAGTELPEFGNNIRADLQPTASNTDVFPMGYTPPAFMYELTLSDGSSLPAWLEFNPDTRALTNTDTPISGDDIEVEYTATEGAGRDSDSVTFTINVEANAVPMAPSSPPDFTFTVRDDISTSPNFSALNGMLPFVAGSGNGDLMYALAAGNMLPLGLSLDPDTAALSGTPTGTAMNDTLTAEEYTYTATDEDGDDIDSTFTITLIDEMPEFSSDDMILDITGTVGTAITTVNLPAATAGTGTTTYSLSPALPGLTFNANADPRTISSTPLASLRTTTFTYTATDADGDTDTRTFTITINAVGDPVDTPLAAPTVDNLDFNAGDEVNPAITLPAFIGGNDPLTYSLTPDIGMIIPGLSFNSDPAVRQISGTVTNTERDDSVSATTFTYAARDADGAMQSATFTITVTDTNITIPEDAQAYRRAPGDDEDITLAEFSGGTGTLMYTLNASPNLPDGLELSMDFSTSRIITVDLLETAESTDPRTYTYTATDTEGETESANFTIQITALPSLNEATASAIPSVGANIALVATQAISSRVELALNGLSSGIDIRTIDGPQLRLNPQQQSGGSGPSVRFGVWYSAASDSLSDTRGDVTWSGDTDTTNLGFDVGFDISPDISLVVGILQNSASTSASYRNTGGDSAGTLSVDLDSTAFYVGLGYDWLDAWFANGSADSTLNDSETMLAIPASFSYQTIGLTVAFEVADSFNIGGKVESLTSDLSLTGIENDPRFNGLATDSSQLRTAFVANYQLKLGENANGLLIPKFELGFRDLSLGTNTMATAVAAAGGSAMETGIGIDYLQRAWGLTVGLDIRSISVENYSSDSTQYQIRWESGSYGNGLSFQLTPHSVSETLGGIDSLYSGGYNQYQSVLERQRGGSSAQDSKGMDFEVGYGIASGYGTVTPYLKTTNYRGIGNRASEFGIRYQTLQGLELTLTAERNLTPQTVQLLGSPLTLTQQEHALTLSTRYSF